MTFEGGKPPPFQKTFGKQEKKKRPLGAPAIKQIGRYNLNNGYTVHFLKSNSRLTFLHTKYLFDMLEAVK